MNLRKLLGWETEAGPRAGETASGSVREIVDALDRLPLDRARHLAGFAYILGRVAHVDLEVSEVETRAMETLLRRLAGLTEDEAILIVRIAKAQHELFGSTENYVVTREFACTASDDEKRALLECLFAVSAADQEVSGPEESEIRRIAGELDLSHAAFVEARAKFREHIGVFKRPPSA